MTYSVPILTNPNALFNLDPVIPVLANILGEVDLRSPMKTAVDCLDSGPLVNVSLVSLKSIPYVKFGKNPVAQEFDNGLSCRMRYFEAGFMATASLVYNVFFSLVFTAASLVTLGQVKIVVDQMRRQWTHTALAAAAVGVATVGTFVPEFGIAANGALLLAAAVGLVSWVQGDVIGKLGTAYQRHSQALKQATLQGLHGDQGLFNREFAPLFNYLDANLNGHLQTSTALREVIDGVSERLPTIMPSTNATPSVVLDAFKRIVSGWGSAATIGTAVTP